MKAQNLRCRVETMSSEAQSPEPPPPEMVPVPFASGDFLFAPTELPPPDTDLETFLRECAKSVNQLICEAWKTGALPKRTALVHCLTNLGKQPGLSTNVSFGHPAIMRRDWAAEKRLRLLGCYLHTTWHLKNHMASSHRRAREKGDITRGTIVVFTKEEPKDVWPRWYSNLLHFGFKGTTLGTLPDFSDCASALQDPSFDRGRDQIPNYNDSYEAFDVEGFLKEVELSDLRSIIQPKPSPAEWDGKTSPAKFFFETREGDTEADVKKSKEAIKRVEERLYKDIKEDHAYRDRVAVTLQCGAIVLSLPQTIYFRGMQHEPPPYFDSGLTVLLARDGESQQPDERPTIQELHQIQAVARKISAFIGSTYGVANMLVQESRMITARNIVSMISHSLKNVFTKAPHEGGVIERRVHLEKIKLDAAASLFDPTMASLKAIDWSTGGYQGEPLEKSITQALFIGTELMTFSAHELKGTKADARLLAVLIELCHNLARWSHKGSVAVSRSPDSSTLVDVTVSGHSAPTHLAGLLARLQEHNVFAKGTALRGWNFILMLVHALAHNTSRCLEVEFVNPKDGKVVAHLVGAAGQHQMLIERPVMANPLPDKMQMRISIRGLKGLHSGK